MPLQYSPKRQHVKAPRLLIGGCKTKKREKSMRFKQLDPHLMDLEEMVVEHNYMQKRLYRLRKLERLGKVVEPILSQVAKREDVLDIAIRERRRQMVGGPL